MKRALVLVVVAACGGGGGGGGGSTPDAGRATGDDDQSGDDDTGSGSNQTSNKPMSTLTSSCATLQGRAIVNENGNLGIAFTEDDPPYTFEGSIQFQLPDGFTGSVPNPEVWDGQDVNDRHIVAVTDSSYQLHGNHCWNGATPSGGSVTITEYDPAAGIVKASFVSYPLHSCTGSDVCTVTGAIETTGEGVFD
ncbi:MAG TPA: hypothetical protein VGC41_00965 [Kofleriaceae bacterium]